MVKYKEASNQKILNFFFWRHDFLFTIIVTTLYPPYHAQNMEVSWGGT